MRQINKRKSNKSLITRIPGRDQENWVIHQNGQNPHLKHHLQLKTKEDVGGSSLGLLRRGRQFTWRWKSKCLVNRCSLGLQRQWDTEWILISRPCPVPPITRSFSLLISDDSTILRRGPLSKLSLFFFFLLKYSWFTMLCHIQIL